MPVALRRGLMLVAAAMLAAWVADVAAQGRPDFSGTWNLNPASVPAPPADGGGGGGGRGFGGGGGGRGFGGGGRGGFGQTFTAKQDAATLTITRTQGDQTVTTVYKLDGSESKNTVQGRGGAQEQVSKAVWDGSKLVVTTTLDFGGNSIEQKRTFSLEGGTLVIEQANPGFGGGAPTTTKLVYKK